MNFIILFCSHILIFNFVPIPMSINTSYLVDYISSSFDPALKQFFVEIYTFLSMR